jgi:glycosyltransferase involved in cell wall biosynthesis
MKQPLVSIITPSYNQGRFIRATIESVLSQDYPSIEYIIMDGGSTDETASIATEYGSRLIFISEPDRGQSHAINKGFRMARGEVVSWLNSDDIILPGAVSHAVRAFERMPSLRAVYGEGYLIDYDGNVTSRFPATEPFNLWKLIYLSDFILQQTVYFRRSVFDEIGFLDENLHWGLDWDLLIRIGKRFPIHYIPEYMGCLREYQAAKSFSGGHARVRELLAIMRRHGRLRYPPGYLTYGLDTYARMMSRYLPFSLLRRGVRFVASRFISYILRESQGLYPDGWASRRMKYMLPAGSGKVRLVGFLPDLLPLQGQSLRIFCNGSLVEQRRLAFGDFEIELDAEECHPEQPLNIEIRASKVLVPARAGIGTDYRRLAYRLLKIEWSGQAGNTTGDDIHSISLGAAQLSA